MFDAKDKKKLIIIGIIAIFATIAITALAVFGGMNALIGTALYASPEIKARKANDFATQATTTPKGGVVFLGDSIMEMYDLDKHFPNKGYINRGISGDKSKDIMDRLQTNVIDIAPSTIIIMVGINDMGYDIPKEEFLNNYEHILRTLQFALPTAKIYIENLYPLRYELTLMSVIGVRSRTHAKIVEWNADITKLAQDNNVGLIDMSPILSGKDGRLQEAYTREGLHISERGYVKISEEISKILDAQSDNL